jgi:hypothetical protein
LLQDASVIQIGRIKPWGTNPVQERVINPKRQTRVLIQPPDRKLVELMQDCAADTVLLRPFPVKPVDATQNMAKRVSAEDGASMLSGIWMSKLAADNVGKDFA